MNEQSSSEVKRQRSSSQSIKRLLQSHNLNDLVFGKRCRTGQQPTTPAYPSVMKGHEQKEQELNSPATLHQEDCPSQPIKGAQKSSSTTTDRIHSQQIIIDRMDQRPSPTEPPKENGKEVPQQTNGEAADQQQHYRQPAAERSKKALARQKMRNVAEMKDDDDGYDLRKHRKIIRKKGPSKGQTTRPQLNRIFHKPTHHPEVNLPIMSLRGDIYKLSLPFLVKKFGPFDIVVLDERISNVLNLDLGSLVQDGMLLVWAEHNEVQLGYHLLKWAGFQVIDQIVWVQTDNNDQLVCKPNNLLTTASCICMVAIKNKPGKYLEYKTKISNNLIFAESGQTPREIYQIAELLMPGSLKLDVFNKRELPGWICMRHQPSENMVDENPTKTQFIYASSKDSCALCQSEPIYQVSFYCETCKIEACRSCLFTKQHPIGHQWRVQPINRPIQENRTVGCFHCDQPIHYGERCYACENCMVWVCTTCQALPDPPRRPDIQGHCHNTSHNLTLLV